MPRDRNDQTIYDAAAASWWSDELRWVRILRNMVPGRLAWFDRHVEWRDARVLDLGCAGGFLSEALARRGARVTGLDPAERAIEAARTHAAAAGLGIRYEIGSGEEMPFADGAFDAVACVDVLEHVRDLDAVLGEVRRVLRPGGRFLYDTINRNPLATFAVVTLAEDVLRILPRGTHDPALFLKPASLAAALRRAGLEPGETTGSVPAASTGGSIRPSGPSPSPP